MLSRGKLHIQVLGKEFPGEIPSGAAILAEEIRKVVNIRFQGADQPKILFVDRGKGFWQMNSGTITKQFKAALKENSLKAYYGENASSQPGNLQEVMLSMRPLWRGFGFWRQRRAPKSHGRKV